jgi:diadenylate cyclase
MFSIIDWPFLVLGALEIVILFFMFYYVFLFFRGSRSQQVLTGLVLVLLFLFGTTRALHFDVLNYLVRKLSVYLAIAFLIIFQPEMRRALAELGKPHVFSTSKTQRNVVDQIVQAAALLAERRIGALIAVEREIGTGAIQETGVRIDSRVVSGLLGSIFFPRTPLHDGGVIIRGERIVAAGCLFPMPQREGTAKSVGTRHRAAVGLTEETDAVVVVVSEETGTISVSFNGRLTRDLDTDRLRRLLYKLLTKSAKNKSSWARAKEQLDLTPEGIARSEDLAQQEKSDAEA